MRNAPSGASFSMHKVIPPGQNSYRRKPNRFIRRNYLMKDCTNGGCECTPNQSIKCTVNNCAHHCQDTQYCGLNSIQVGTHETNPTQIECTDCQSFKLK